MGFFNRFRKQRPVGQRQEGFKKLYPEVTRSPTLNKFVRKERELQTKKQFQQQAKAILQHENQSRFEKESLRIQKVNSSMGGKIREAGRRLRFGNPPRTEKERLRREHLQRRSNQLRKADMGQLRGDMKTIRRRTLTGSLIGDSALDNRTARAQFRERRMRQAKPLNIINPEPLPRRSIRRRRKSLMDQDTSELFRGI